jgi:hypothetical protein
MEVAVKSKEPVWSVKSYPVQRKECLFPLVRTNGNGILIMNRRQFDQIAEDQDMSLNDCREFGHKYDVF